MNGGPGPAGFMVHGVGRDPAEPDWPPLTGPEVAGVLACYGPPSHAGATPGWGGVPALPTEIIWWSPRPMSAAALVRWNGTSVFVKRHDKRVRTTRQLAAEHAFATYLRGEGIPSPAVLKTRDGATTVTAGSYVYEVHEAAMGADLYRDALSWTPFASQGHAWSAGAALAALHRAAVKFPWPARPPGVLINSCCVLTAPDPVAALHSLLARRPGLAAYLNQRPWLDDMSRDLLPGVAAAAPLIADLPRHWCHGDWHPSNLTWSSDGPGAGVAGVLDFGLANRTFAAHDLALALERSVIGWLDLAGSGRAEVDMQAAAALLDGYASVRPLSGHQVQAVAALLPVVHLEYALSEVEYYAAVVGDAGNAGIAYHDYLIGHAAWFRTTAAAGLLRLMTPASL